MTRQDGEGAAREKTDPSGQGTEGGGGVHCVWRRGLDSAWAGEIGGRRRGEKFAGLNTLNDTAHELIGPHVTVLPETPALSALRRRRTTNSSTSTRPLSSSTPHPSPPRHSPPTISSHLRLRLHPPSIIALWYIRGQHVLVLIIAVFRTVGGRAFEFVPPRSRAQLQVSWQI